jgi:hypothetical protein
MQQASSHAGSLMAGYMTISINHVAVYEIGESVERREGVRPGRTPASYTKTELAVHAHGKLHGRLPTPRQNSQCTLMGSSTGVWRSKPVTWTPPLHRHNHHRPRPAVSCTSCLPPTNQRAWLTKGCVRCCLSLDLSSNSPGLHRQSRWDESSWEVVIIRRPVVSCS